MTILRVLSVPLILMGAALCVAGTLAPWANIRVLRVDAGLPGVAFAAGGLCLSVAVLVLMGARRFPVLCVLGAAVILTQANGARTDVPRRVHGQLIGAQMGLYPVNRLLDQFHIPNLDVADVSRPAADLLGPGVAWTLWGGGLLLAGGLLGLPTDPAVVWTLNRTVRVRCPSCSHRWVKGRGAFFCPACGAALTRADRRPCVRCARVPVPGDVFCAGCGQEL